MRENLGIDVDCSSLVSKARSQTNGVYSLGEQPTAMRPLKLLFSQQTGWALLQKNKSIDTVDIIEEAHQLFPPTPMTDRGLQLRPTAVLCGTTRPRRLMMRLAVLSLAWVTELQH